MNLVTNLQNKESTWNKRKLPITLKQKIIIMKNRFRATKIPDDYHTLDRAG